MITSDFSYVNVEAIGNLNVRTKHGNIALIVTCFSVNMFPLVFIGELSF